MATWAIIVIIILVAATLLLGGFLFYQNQTQLQSSNEDNLINFFSVQENKTTNLTCPTGRSISLIDAWYELYDPNFQCTSNPSPCAPGMDSSGEPVFPSSQCEVSGVSSGDNVDSSLWELKGSGPSAAYSALVCRYEKDGMPKDDSTPCISMNALGYLANVVNGQNSTTISGSVNGDFGPAPCSDAGDIPYAWPIGAPFSSNDPGDDPSMSMGYSGYYGHGVYMCTLDT